MRKALAKAGPASGALVYDLTTGRTLFAQRDNTGRPPASVEKLYTTLAVVRLLGPGARLHTAVLGKGHMGRHGVWHGNLYLRRRRRPDVRRRRLQQDLGGRLRPDRRRSWSTSWPRTGFTRSPAG